MTTMLEAMLGGSQRFAVTNLESGGAKIVTARDHKAALKAARPLISYLDGEVDYYDDIDGGKFKEDPGMDRLVQKYQKPGSKDYPMWDEAAGPVMAWRAPNVADIMLVYPIQGGNEAVGEAAFTRTGHTVPPGHKMVFGKLVKLSKTPTAFGGSRETPKDFAANKIKMKYAQQAHKAEVERARQKRAERDDEE